jgi:hypothetical protein
MTEIASNSNLFTTPDNTNILEEKNILSSQINGILNNTDGHFFEAPEEQTYLIEYENLELDIQVNIEEQISEERADVDINNNSIDNLNVNASDRDRNDETSLIATRQNFSILDNSHGWVGQETNNPDLGNPELILCACPICQGSSIDESLSDPNNNLIIENAEVPTLAKVFSLHSNPNAKAKIFLDFDGGITSGAFWNSIKGGANIVTPGFSLDTDTTTFTTTELTRIENIWKRVAEDFSPFNIDITTEDPKTFTAKSAIRVAIGGSSSDWYGSSAGGVAYVGSWTWGNNPVFVFENNLGNGDEKYTAEAISHEVGHALGLRHQSTYDSSGGKTQEYNSGSNGWAPIMGVGYYQNLSTWHNGTNSLSSTSYQDDLAIIAGTNNGFGYRVDDYGDTIATAKALSGNTLNVSGVISQMSDVDIFSFTTGTGNVSFNINVAELGPDLDVVAELWNANTLIVDSKSTTTLSASLSSYLNAGTYYLKVKGTGEYGRVGQYSVAGTVTPSNQEPTLPGITVSDVTVQEGNSGTSKAVITLNLSQASTNTVTVNYATANNSASAGSDYTASNGTVTFSPGTTSQTISVDILGELITESNESFFINLSNANNATISDNQALVTIQNDDQTTLSIGDVTIVEGNSGTKQALVTVSLSQPSSNTVTVNYATANNSASAGSDYTASNGTVTFSPGTTSQTISVDILGELITESNESFFINLSNANNATISDNQALVTIQNDDQTTLSIGDVTIVEGNSGTKQALVTVSLSQPSSNTVTANYATANNSALAGEDYTASNGTVTFSPGTTSQTISLDILGDEKVESDESFFLNLSNANNANINDNQAIVNIENDDVPRIEIKDVSILEGNNGVTKALVTVYLSEATDRPISLNYSTQDMSATVESQDYIGSQGTISFAAGQKSQTITVDIVGDTKVESDKDFCIVLDNASNALIEDSEAIVTIKNDDLPEVAIGEVGKASANSGVVTIKLQNQYQNPVVFAQPLSRNGGDPAIVRVSNIQSDSFNVFIQEPTTNDGRHISENFSYIVMEAGTWELNNGAIVQVGKIDSDANVNSNWKNITFDESFSNTPVVFSQVQTNNSKTFVRTREQQLSNNGFSIAMEKQESLVNSPYTSETLGYFAMSSGKGNWNGHTYQAYNTADEVSSKWYNVNFGQQFIEAPQIFANISSYDDADSAGLRYRSLSNSSVQLIVEEDRSTDTEITHTTEKVSFMAIEGSGLLTGKVYDSVTGGQSLEPIVGQVDLFTGTNNIDTFILGNNLESYYALDANNDYAIIEHFDRRQDFIQLYGTSNDYHLAATDGDLPQGTAIFRHTVNGDELVGVVVGTSSLSLDQKSFKFS